MEENKMRVRNGERGIHVSGTQKEGEEWGKGNKWKGNRRGTKGG